MPESFDVGSLVEEFRDEARDQVDRLDAVLLEIEREGSLEHDARSEILRTLHTLKGNAGMLGLGPIRDYVHALENVLKAPAREWPEPLLERLFEGAAALRRGVDAAGRDEEAAAFQALTAARHRIDEVEGPSDDGPGPTGQDDAGGAAAGADPSDLLRVPFSKLDTLLNEVGEMLGEADALRDAAAGAAAGVRERAETIRRRTASLHEHVMSLRLVPIGRTLGRFPAMVRRLAREQGKEARLVVEGESTQVDKATADALAEPMLHLIRNAVDHGIEPPDVRERRGKPRHGTVAIRARQEGDRIRIEVSDDGAGLALEGIRARALEAGLIDRSEAASDREVAALVFRPGFSTRTEVSTVSGRGVGLDVVLRRIRSLRGELELEPGGDAATRFIIRLPLTVVVVPSLVFRAADELLALPASAISRTLRLEATERVGTTEVVRDGDELVPLARPAALFGWDSGERDAFALLVRYGGRSAAVTAERLLDQRELVVKALPAYGGRARAIAGASVLPGGRLILLLDPAELMELNLERSGVSRHG